MGYNLTQSLAALGDDVDLSAIVGNDMVSKLVLSELNDVTTGELISQQLSQTPSSVVLYDKSGARRVTSTLE